MVFYAVTTIVSSNSTFNSSSRDIEGQEIPEIPEESTVAQPNLHPLDKLFKVYTNVSGYHSAVV